MSKDSFQRPDLDNLLEGFQIIGFDWKYLYLNNIALIQSRLQKEDLVGKRFDEVWPGIKETELYRLIKDCLEKRTAHHLENEFAYNDQALGWFELSIQPVPEGVLILSIDRSESHMAEIERKMTADALRLNEDKYRYMFASNPQPMWIYDLETLSFLEVNDAAVANYGYSKEEFLSMTLKDIRPPEDVEALLKDVSETEKSYNSAGVWRHLKKNKELMFVEIISHTVKFNGRDARHVIVNNITGRKNVEDALRKSEDLFNKAFHGSPSPMTIASQKDGSYIAVNDSFLNLTGFNREEVIGKRGNELNLIDDAERNKIITGLQKEGKIYNIEVNARSRYGSPLYLLTSIENTELAGEASTIATMLDITERKIIEEALRNSEYEFRLLAESMPQIVWITRPDGWNIYFNQLWVTYTGLSLEESYGHGWIKPFHPEDQPLAWDAWQNATKNGSIYSIECRLRRNDGVYTWWLIRGVPVFDSDGKVMKWFGTCTDINELKIAEEEILKLNTDLEMRVVSRTSQLESVNNELEAFSYSVSHDLRAPLRSISGFTQILVDEYGSKMDKEANRLCSIIQENSIKMGILIDDLLAFSRINRTELQKSVVKMKEMVRLVYEDLTDEASLKRIEFNLGDLCNTSGDPKLLKQVWINLISNAIKYSSKKEKAIITIGCKKEGGYSVYNIKDNGAGFDMAYMDKLFGVFQRLHGHKEFEGTGVGLAIVQRIVQRHGGKTWAKGEVDNGAEFYFSIPIMTDL